jgi:hypothetical protein
MGGVRAVRGAREKTGGDPCCSVEVTLTVLLGPRRGDLLAALSGLVGAPHRALELVADLGQTVAARRFGVLEALLAQRQQDPEPGMRTVEDLRRMLPLGGLDEPVEGAVEVGPGWDLLPAKRCHRQAGGRILANFARIRPVGFACAAGRRCATERPIRPPARRFPMRPGRTLVLLVALIVAGAVTAEAMFPWSDPNGTRSTSEPEDSTPGYIPLD